MVEGGSMILTLPLQVPIGRKTMRLSLNIYERANYHALSKAKKAFELTVYPQVFQLPKYSKISLTYTIYFGDKGNRDVNNFCSVIDKLFCDSMVRQGKLPDDNFKHLTETHFFFGGIDPKNERCEVEILEIF
jgi:hypothetical protein